MKWIEIRRHSKRRSPQIHLSQEGLDLARKIGQNMGTFDLVLTSDLPRALETAVAMGFAVNQQESILSEFEGYSHQIEADTNLQKYYTRMALFLKSVANSLQENQKALIISHSGVLEVLATCLGHTQPPLDLRRGFDFCEGFRMSFVSGELQGIELLFEPL